jgi:hypothetical protein
MPQIDFFLNEDERIQLIQYAFKIGCKVIPDLHYHNDEFETAIDLESYLKFCSDSPFLFLINKKYSFYPLEFDFYEETNTRIYFIKKRYGGPSIDFFSPIIGEKEDNTIGPGYIGIYPFYFHNNRKIVPTKELTDVYNLLSSFIRKISIKVELVNRIYWVGNTTIKRAKKGGIKLVPISDINILEKI